MRIPREGHQPFQRSMVGGKGKRPDDFACGNNVIQGFYILNQGFLSMNAVSAMGRSRSSWAWLWAAYIPALILLSAFS
jgi:hypothetical protein